MNFPINSYDFTNYYTAIDRKGVRKYTRDGLNGWGTKFVETQFTFSLPERVHVLFRQIWPDDPE